MANGYDKLAEDWDTQSGEILDPRFYLKIIILHDGYLSQD